jgi:hypothetical protein
MSDTAVVVNGYQSHLVIYLTFNTRISISKIQVPLFMATCFGIKYHLLEVNSPHSSPPDFHTATHIHIPYTSSPQIRHITILTTDFHHIGIIHTISKDLNISIPPTRIQYIGNIKGFKTYSTNWPIAIIVPFDCIYIVILNLFNIVILTIDLPM